MKNLKLGLLGKNISHSQSQRVYEEILKIEIDYKLFDYNKEAEIPSLEEFFLKVDGLSVTSPYKPYFFSQLELDEVAENIGGVNCIKKEDGKFFGTITDYYAIEEIFLSILKKEKFSKFIILGDGIMSSLTQKLFDKEKVDYFVFSRKKTNDFNQLDLKEKCGSNLFVVNTCSRSYKYSGKLSADDFFWDYNYLFDPHYLLTKQYKCRYLDGLSLLKSQAFYALKFWKIL